MLGWSSYIGRAIYAKNFYSVYFYLKTAEVFMILAALSSPPYFILSLQTDPYAPFPISLIKM